MPLNGTNLINKQLAESHPIVNVCCVTKPFIAAAEAAAAATEISVNAFIAPYEIIIIILKVKVTALN